MARVSSGLLLRCGGSGGPGIRNALSECHRDGRLTLGTDPAVSRPGSPLVVRRLPLGSDPAGSRPRSPSVVRCSSWLRRLRRLLRLLLLILLLLLLLLRRRALRRGEAGLGRRRQHDPANRAAGGEPDRSARRRNSPRRPLPALAPRRAARSKSNAPRSRMSDLLSNPRPPSLRYGRGGSHARPKRGPRRARFLRRRSRSRAHPPSSVAGPRTPRSRAAPGRVDDRGLGLAGGVCTVARAGPPKARHPFINRPGVLGGADVAGGSVRLGRACSSGDPPTTSAPASTLG